jgi:glutathione reductase (NADPH)
MSQYNYDLFVIGAGSGGVRAARLAAQGGARVAIAEDYRIGGTCVIRGCVPKKLLVYASEFSQAFRDAKGYGWTVDWARFDWQTLRDNVQMEVSRLSSIYRANMEKAGVKIFDDRATLVDANTVRLTGEGAAISAERILVATGGHVTRPRDLKGHELAITSNEAFLMDELPARILIVGGGYIAVEFATIFSGLGVETTLAYRGDVILRGFDDDVRKHVQEEMRRAGVNIVTETVIKEIAALADGKRLATLSNGMRLEVDQVMLAVGREPNTKDMGLDQVGVQLTRAGAIEVDDYSRTNVPSIFALGDVTGRLNLTPVAIREAQAFVETEFNKRPTAFDRADVATAVFSRPPVGTVGLSESEALQRGEARIFKTNFRPMKNIIAGNEQRTLMKLVVDAKTDRMLGVHIAGPDAPEMIQLAAVAVKAGLTMAQWDATCAVHPTAAEELVLMR